MSKAKRAYPKFNPEGMGYDEKTADEVISFSSALPTKPLKYQGEVIRTSESFQAWVWHEDLKDYRLHGASLDPRTGMVLKGRGHPTWDLMEQEETRLGNKIIKKNGRYYSVPK